MADTVEKINTSDAAQHLADEYEPGSYITPEEQSDNLTMLSPEDMTPESYALYQKEARKHGAQGVTRVYLDTSNEAHDAQVKYVKTPSGMHAVIINSNEHQWSEHYGQSLLLDKDEIENNNMHITEKNHVSLGITKEVWDSYNKASANLGLQPTPELYLDTNPLPEKSAYSQMSTQGTMYVFIKSDILNYPSDEQTGILGHELGHHRNGDTTASGAARTHNGRDYKASQAAELAATLVGNGPHGTCNQDGIIHYDQTVTANYNANNAVQYETKNDPEHPTSVDEIQALLAVKAQMGGKCEPWPSPINTPSVKKAVITKNIPNSSR